MWASGKAIRAAAHRLVAFAFLGEPPSPKHEVAHNDGVPWHNHYTNLRWDTPRGNYCDRYIHGTHQFGELNWSAKLTAADVLRIRERTLFGAEVGDTARLFGVHRATISGVLKRESWMHI
jgi:HNH endonuclease